MVIKRKTMNYTQNEMSESKLVMKNINRTQINEGQNICKTLRKQSSKSTYFHINNYLKFK